MFSSSPLLPIVINDHFCLAYLLLDFVQFLNSSAEKDFIRLNEFLRKGSQYPSVEIHDAGFCLSRHLRPKIVQSRVLNLLLIKDKLKVKRRDPMSDFTLEEKERTSVLANERTYAAWIRTGLAALITGLAIERFLEGVIPFVIVRTISISLLLLSIISFDLGDWRYQHVGARIPTFHVSGAPVGLLIGISAYLGILGILSIIGLLIMKPFNTQTFDFPQRVNERSAVEQASPLFLQ